MTRRLTVAASAGAVVKLGAAGRGRIGVVVPDGSGALW
jgi:hypothetical protein